MDIHTDERLRERQSGKKGNGGVGVSFKDMINKRWSDKQWHEEGGESLYMVQERNIEAVKEIAAVNDGKTIVIGTHGTALSTIMNYYDPDFGAEDFFRIVDWMPYIVELDIENGDLVSKTEIAHIEKEYKGQ
jgi:2,3-bisphosphoglycerate-dependent phosphoglycerate mutase